jgi:hypothetical protein
VWLISSPEEKNFFQGPGDGKAWKGSAIT